MAAMSPEEMAQLQSQAGKPEGGGLIELAQKTGEGLRKLAEALDRSPDSSDDEKAQMAQVLSGFSELVEQKLGGEPGPKEEAPPQALSMEGGASGVPMNMKMRS